MKKNMLIGLIFYCSLSQAQNIIPNPSFEDTVVRITPLFLPVSWDSPNVDGFDYYTPLNSSVSADWTAPKNIAGYQDAKSGDSYIGIRIYDLYQPYRSGVREYAQARLKTQLVQDSIYCLQLHMSMADSIVFASRNQMGIYFSTNAVSANNALHLPYSPQIIISPDEFNTDKENWTKYSFQYTATGDERYITIGNFNDTNSLDTLFVGGGNKFWMEASYYYLDDFYLGHCDSLPEDTAIGLRENNLERQINVYPNPTKNELFIQYQGKEKLQIQLYNLFGQSVETASYLAVTSKNYELSLGHLPKGIYFLTVSDGVNRITKKIIKQ